ncbi:Hypothetical_protein [Hexamita inflata]|uniref:Hypothetical_protein n=1 Tax=Hexamita inflata TaxID=28002 RepID=A0AA86QKS1_9EUKA|nr:Hypothetical protein HINF_LOCUS42609 [Hexamita inflata]
MILFVNCLQNYPNCIFPNTWNSTTQKCECRTTFAISATNCSQCSKCDEQYGGILGNNGECTCVNSATDPKLCCNKCNNIAQDPQSNCTTCLDIYADFDQKCYVCIKGAVKVLLPASMGGSPSCTQKALVKEGKKISLIVGIIYAVITFIFVVINVLKCIKNKKAMKQ